MHTLEDKLPRQFKLRRKREVTPKQHEKSTEIHELFNEMETEYGMKSLAVFLAAAQGLHRRFLSNVRTCPAFVLSYCQHQLAPEALATHRRQKEALRQATLAKLREKLQSTEKAAP